MLKLNVGSYGKGEGHLSTKFLNEFILSVAFHSFPLAHLRSHLARQVCQVWLGLLACKVEDKRHCHQVPHRIFLFRLNWETNSLGGSLRPLVATGCSDVAAHHRIRLISDFWWLRSVCCSFFGLLHLIYMSLVCFLHQLTGKGMVYIVCCCFIAALPLPGRRVFCCQVICAVVLECRPANDTLPLYPWRHSLRNSLLHYNQLQFLQPLFCCFFYCLDTSTFTFTLIPAPDLVSLILKMV